MTSYGAWTDARSSVTDFSGMFGVYGGDDQCTRNGPWVDASGVPVLAGGTTTCPRTRHGGGQMHAYAPDLRGWRIRGDANLN